MNLMAMIGPQRKRKRIASGVGLREMARAMAIDVRYLWDMERGGRPFTAEMIIRQNAAFTSLETQRSVDVIP